MTSATATPAQTERGGAFAALRFRDYTLFWCGAVISNTGTWMQTITVPFVIFQLTHSTVWVGFSAFMAFAPALLVGPLAGSLADRFPRKQVILVTQSVMMILAFALWGMWVFGVATPWLIIANLAVSGVAAGINIAAWQSFVPQLVPPEHMLNAIRLNSMQFTAARAFGPALAGLVLAELGPASAFFINAVTYVLVLAALVAVHPRPVDVPADSPPFLQHFRAGLAYVRERTALVLPVVTILVLSLFGSSVIQLAAPLSRQVFDVGKAEYGLLVATFGAGAIIGSFVTLAYGDRIRRSRMALLGLAVFAVGEIVLGAAPTYLVGLVGLAAMGVAYLMVAVSLNTSIQARVDESHRGRVLSIYLMGLLAGVPLGALLGGVLADVIGLRATIVGGGSVLAIFALIALVVFDAMRPLDESLEETERIRSDALLTNQPYIAGAD
jgi:MFS family permease